MLATSVVGMSDGSFFSLCVLCVCVCMLARTYAYGEGREREGGKQGLRLQGELAYIVYVKRDSVGVNHI